MCDKSSEQNGFLALYTRVLQKQNQNAKKKKRLPKSTKPMLAQETCLFSPREKKAKTKQKQN